MSSILGAIQTEIDQMVEAMNLKKSEFIERVELQVEELQLLREQLGVSIGTEEARAKVRAIAKRAGLAEDPKRQAQLKAQDVRVRMRAPADIVAPPPSTAAQKKESSFSRGPSKIVVSGSLQRELAVIDARIVELMLEGASIARQAEVALLSDIRAGVNGLLSEMPEHDVLLGLVADFSEQVDGVLRDLSAGGASRMKRLYDHARELLSRLRSVSKIETKDKAMKQDVERLAKVLESVKKELGKPTEPAVSAAEKALLEVHKTLGDRGILGSRSLLFSALRSSEARQA